MNEYKIDDMHFCKLKVDISWYAYVNAEVVERGLYNKEFYKTSVSKIIHRPTFIEKILGITFEDKIRQGIEKVKRKIDIEFKKVLENEKIAERLQLK